MFTRTALSLFVLAVASASKAAADSCYAEGSYDYNESGFGPGGTTDSASTSVKLYNSDGVQIGAYDQCTKCDNACTDLITVPTSNLTDVFEWGSSCDVDGFK